MEFPLRTVHSADYSRFLTGPQKIKDSLVWLELMDNIICLPKTLTIVTTKSIGNLNHCLKSIRELTKRELIIRTFI